MQLLAPKPHNLRLKGARLVESDVYHVCERMKEIDPNLYVMLQEGHPKPWVIMEMCADGECRMVGRYDELTPKILDHLREMLATPFQERIDKLQKQLDYENDYARQMRDSGEWERFLWEFNRELRVCNFVDQKYFKSVRPVKKKRGGN